VASVKALPPEEKTQKLLLRFPRKQFRKIGGDEEQNQESSGGIPELRTELLSLLPRSGSQASMSHVNRPRGKFISSLHELELRIPSRAAAPTVKLARTLLRPAPRVTYEERVLGGFQNHTLSSLVHSHVLIDGQNARHPLVNNVSSSHGEAW